MLKNVLLQEFSQILVQEIGDRSASQEGIEEKKFHEPHLHQAYLEFLFYYPCESIEDTKEPWTTIGRACSLHKAVYIVGKFAQFAQGLVLSLMSNFKMPKGEFVGQFA
jgi:hypothetical protein